MSYTMKTTKDQQTTKNLLVQVVRNFLGKLRQNPDVYPIRYYKKGKQFRRKWQGPLVK